MQDKEKIYDEEISPLMKQIISICKEKELPMFCAFQFNDDGMSISEIPGHIVFKVCHAAVLSRQGASFNIDKLLIWIIREFDVACSTFLYTFAKKKNQDAPQTLRMWRKPAGNSQRYAMPIYIKDYLI